MRKAGALLLYGLYADGERRMVNMRNHSVFSSTAIALANDILRKGVDLRLKPFGSSMTPFIRDGDQIVVRRVNPVTLRLGDIIAFQDFDSLIIHRIVKKKKTRTGDILFWTKGDYSVKDIQPRTLTEIRGKLVAVHKGHKRFVLERRFWKSFNFVIAKLSMLEASLVRLCHINEAKKRTVWHTRLLVAAFQHLLYFLSQAVFFFSSL